MTSCPIGAGEEWGQRWDFHRLVENHDIDFNRCTLPNVGGITEMLKIAALCETHDIGLVPSLDDPIDPHPACSSRRCDVHRLGYPL